MHPPFPFLQGRAASATRQRPFNKHFLLDAFSLVVALVEIGTDVFFFGSGLGRQKRLPPPPPPFTFSFASELTFALSF